MSTRGFHSGYIFQKAPITRFHENIFKGTIVISTLGASITFQVVIQQIESDLNVSRYHTFHRKTARNFLAIAWLLFICSLGIACMAAILLALNEDKIHSDEDIEEGYEGGKYEAWALVASGLLLLLMLSAFFFCSLAVTSYCEGAGWAGAAVMVIFLIMSTVLWFFHMTSRKKIRQKRQSRLFHVPSTKSVRRQSTVSAFEARYAQMGKGERRAQALPLRDMERVYKSRSIRTAKVDMNRLANSGVAEEFRGMRVTLV